MAEADFMEDQIGERQKQIDQIQHIFKDINLIAKDLALETAAQGEKLEKLDEHVEVAAKNANEGVQ